MEKYLIYRQIGEGSFSQVFAAKLITPFSRQMVAIKRLYPLHDKYQDTPQTVLQEVSVLKVLSPHPQIVQFIESFYDSTWNRHCIVTELMEYNLYEYVQQVHQGHPLPESLVRILIWQLLSALAHLHCHHYFHRDIKPENLLLNTSHHSVVPLLKLADFGGTRKRNLPPPYTDYIATRWYRAPECFMTSGYYTFKVDLWSVGCVMFELLAGKPLFAAPNELLQIQCINDLFGPLPDYNSAGRMMDGSTKESYKIYTNDVSSLGHGRTAADVVFSQLQKLLPECSLAALRLLSCLLSVNPIHRVSAGAALRFTFFNPLHAPGNHLAVWMSETCRAGFDEKRKEQCDDEVAYHTSQMIHQESIEERIDRKLNEWIDTTSIMLPDLNKWSLTKDFIKQNSRTTESREKTLKCLKGDPFFKSAQSPCPYNFFDTQTTAPTEAPTEAPTYTSFGHTSAKASMDLSLSLETLPVLFTNCCHSVHHESFQDASLTSSELNLYLDTLQSRHQESLNNHHPMSKLKKFILRFPNTLVKKCQRLFSSLRHTRTF